MKIPLLLLLLPLLVLAGGPDRGEARVLTGGDVHSEFFFDVLHSHEFRFRVNRDPVFSIGADGIELHGNATTLRGVHSLSNVSSLTVERIIGGANGSLVLSSQREILFVIDGTVVGLVNSSGVFGGSGGGGGGGGMVIPPTIHVDLITTFASEEPMIAFPDDSTVVFFNKDLDDIGALSLSSLAVSAGASISGATTTGTLTVSAGASAATLSVSGTASANLLQAGSATVTGLTGTNSLSVDTTATVGGVLTVSTRVDTPAINSNGGTLGFRIGNVEVGFANATGLYGCAGCGGGGGGGGATSQFNLWQQFSPSNANVLAFAAGVIDAQTNALTNVGGLSSTTLTVSGLATVDSLSVATNAAVTGTLSVAGNAGVAGTTTTNVLSVATDAAVTGTATIGTLSVAGNAGVAGTTTTNVLSVATNAAIGTLTVAGNAGVAGTTTTNVLSVATDAAVTGTATIGTLSVAGNAGVAGTTTTNVLSVATNAAVAGTATVGTLSVTGNAGVAGTTTTANLAVTVNATVANTASVSALLVSNNASVGGTTFTGNLIVSGTASVAGATTLNSLAATGNAVIGGSATANSLAVTGNAVVGGSATANSLAVTGNAVVGGSTSTNSLAVTGNAVVSGIATVNHVVVNGNVTFNPGSSVNISGAGFALGNTLAFPITGQSTISAFQLRIQTGTIPFTALSIDSGGVSTFGNHVNIFGDLTFNSFSQVFMPSNGLFMPGGMYTGVAVTAPSARPATINIFFSWSRGTLSVRMPANTGSATSSNTMKWTISGALTSNIFPVSGVTVFAPFLVQVGANVQMGLISINSVGLLTVYATPNSGIFPSGQTCAWPAQAATLASNFPAF